MGPVQPLVIPGSQARLNSLWRRAVSLALRAAVLVLLPLSLVIKLECEIAKWLLDRFPGHTSDMAVWYVAGALHVIAFRTIHRFF